MRSCVKFEVEIKAYVNKSFESIKSIVVLILPEKMRYIVKAERKKYFNKITMHFFLKKDINCLQH